jgi:hypothetical protein
MRIPGALSVTLSEEPSVDVQGCIAAVEYLTNAIEGIVQVAMKRLSPAGLVLSLVLLAVAAAPNPGAPRMRPRRPRPTTSTAPAWTRRSRPVTISFAIANGKWLEKTEIPPAAAGTS